jgi:hypothetical protein
MLDFREILSHCDLHDLDFRGKPWTFDNKQAGERNVRVRLNRAVVSPSWSSWFPEPTLQHIVSPRSDHCPILLHMVTRDESCKTQHIFRYEVMWERETTLPEEIKTAWERGNSVNNLMDIADSLQGVKRQLTSWSKSKFGAVTKELAKLPQRLECLESQGGHANHTEALKVTKHQRLLHFS